MRRHALLVALTALCLAALPAPAAQASHDTVGASYLFVLQGDNGGETPEQPAIQIKGTVSVAEDGTATAWITMNVRENGESTAYRSSTITTAQIDENRVVIETEMLALDLVGTRPSPPVPLAIEATFDDDTTQPGSANPPAPNPASYWPAHLHPYLPATYTVGALPVIDGAILVVSAADGPMP